jgi:hypothetical protein
VIHPAHSGRLIGGIVVHVRRRQRNYTLDSLLSGERKQFADCTLNGERIENNPVTPRSAEEMVSGRDGFPSTTSTWAGKAAVRGLRVTPRMRAPWL